MAGAVASDGRARSDFPAHLNLANRCTGSGVDTARSSSQHLTLKTERIIGKCSTLNAEFLPRSFTMRLPGKTCLESAFGFQNLLFAARFPILVPQYPFQNGNQTGIKYDSFYWAATIWPIHERKPLVQWVQTKDIKPFIPLIQAAYSVLSIHWLMFSPGLSENAFQ